MFIQAAEYLRKLSLKRTKSFVNLCRLVVISTCYLPFSFFRILICNQSLVCFSSRSFLISSIMFIQTAGHLRKLSFRRTASFVNLCRSVVFSTFHLPFSFSISQTSLHNQSLVYLTSCSFLSVLKLFLFICSILFIQTAGHLRKLSFKRTTSFVNLCH